MRWRGEERRGFFGFQSRGPDAQQNQQSFSQKFIINSFCSPTEHRTLQAIFERKPACCPSSCRRRAPPSAGPSTGPPDPALAPHCPHSGPGFSLLTSLAEADGKFIILWALLFRSQYFGPKIGFTEPSKPFSQLSQQHRQPRALHKKVLQSLGLPTEDALPSHPRIHVSSVSVCGCCPMYRPPLEVSCPLLSGQLVQWPPAAFWGNVWAKNLRPPRLLQPCQRLQVQDRHAYLVERFFPLRF